MSDQNPMTPPEDAAANRRSSRSDGSAFLQAFCLRMWEWKRELEDVAKKAAESGDYAGALERQIRARTFNEAKEEAERIFFDMPNKADSASGT